MIFETHSHYDDDKFDDDRDSLLSSLRDEGIEYVVNIGASISSCKKTLELLARYEYIYGAIGIHPNDVEQLEEASNREWLESQLVNNPKVKAVGEIGLDYYYDEPSIAVQKKWFEYQIELARSLKKPMVIHSREAAADTYDMMKALNCKDIGGVIHCFSYSVEEAKKYIDMGFYIGVGGVVTFKNGKKLKEVVEHIPIDRILLETDCPYLAPEPNRGKRNSSLNIPYIAKEIARLKGMEYNEVVEITNKNARRMYGI